eukprot:4863207-Pleurochrysis_carterae.AAC.2
MALAALATASLALQLPTPLQTQRGEQLLLSRYGIPSDTLAPLTTSRRAALGLGVAAAAAGPLLGRAGAAFADEGMFSVPPLPYAYVRAHPFMRSIPLLTESSGCPSRQAASVPKLASDALEPHVDAATMKFHHDFHHQAYVKCANSSYFEQQTSLDSEARFSFPRPDQLYTS